MKRRAFTLIEVLVSLAIFAVAAVSLGAAYSNVLLSRIAMKQDEQRLDDRARCRAALLETPGFDDVEAGGEIHLPGGRTARWEGKIEATSTWSIPSDRQKIRDDARQRLEKERGYKEADGNSAFISAPTRGKKLIPAQPVAGGKGGKGQPAPSNGKNGQPGGQPAARPAKK